MFYAYPYLASHPATHLNQQLVEFFTNLQQVDERSQFILTTSLFPQSLLDRLNRSSATVLRDLFKNYFEAFKKLKPLERQAVIDQFTAIQDIESWLNDVTLQPYKIINENLPVSLRTPAAKLFKYLYENTLSLTDHYKIFHKTIPNKTCPFCGIEGLPTPKPIRADYDHWLYKAKYPFLAVNMRNLIPMGERCNRNYKKDQDLLVNQAGTRRQFYYPYKDSFLPKISLTGSQLPKTDQRGGKWIINFSNTNSLIEDWAEVFCIRERYANELTDQFYNWTKVFKKEYDTRVVDIHTLKESFARHAKTFEDVLYYQPNLVKHGLFIFLASCNDYTYYNAVLRDMGVRK